MSAQLQRLPTLLQDNLCVKLLRAVQQASCTLSRSALGTVRTRSASYSQAGLHITQHLHVSAASAFADRYKQVSFTFTGRPAQGGIRAACGADFSSAALHFPRP